MSAAQELARPLPAAWALAGRILRALPHFAGRWRLLSALYGRFLRGRGYRTTVEFDGGQKMLVDLDDWIPYQIFLTGYYDVETVHTRFFRGLVQDGTTVFDVGANVGYYTLQAARRVGPRGRVHAFEPVAATHRRLAENVRLNGWSNVVLNQAAVADRVGELTVFVADGTNTGASGVAPPPNLSGRTETVPATTLDAYVEDRGVGAVDLLKIDVEGSEMAVLAGAERILRQPRLTVLVEVSPRTLASQGTTPEDLIDRLRSFGFTPWRITGRGLRPFEGPLAGKESLVLFRKD